MKLSQVTEEMNNNFKQMIGSKVWKKPINGSVSQMRKEPNPFKSGLKINTVSGTIIHPITGCLAFTFVEDDSYVACHICSKVPEGVTNE